jgi:hypothetical protein
LSVILFLVMNHDTKPEKHVSEEHTMLSGSKRKPSKKPTGAGGKLSSFWPLLLLVSSLPYSSTLQWRRCVPPKRQPLFELLNVINPEDCPVHSDRCENLKSSMLQKLFIVPARSLNVHFYVCLCTHCIRELSATVETIQ